MFLKKFGRNFMDLPRKFEETEGNIEKIYYNGRKYFRNFTLFPV